MLYSGTLQAFQATATSITPLLRDQFPVGLRKNELSKEIHCTEFHFCIINLTVQLYKEYKP